MEDMTGYTLTLLEQLVFDGGASACEACAELLRRERERCAKECEQQVDQEADRYAETACRTCAERIRGLQ